jgi:polyhydroxyalkanoate synthesis repressor PhaR
MAEASERADAAKPVVIKKYANRRLYNTETSTYITLETLAGMVREGRDFTVVDAKSGDDITRSVLTQIIVDEESKDGRALLPTQFLRQLIGLYGDSLQGVVPNYLESAMAQFSRQQEQMRSAMEQTMGSFLPPGMEEIGRQNMQMIERAMTLFSPYGAKGKGEAPAAEERDEVASLRAEVQRLKAELAAVRGKSASD